MLVLVPREFVWLGNAYCGEQMYIWYCIKFYTNEFCAKAALTYDAEQFEKSTEVKPSCRLTATRNEAVRGAGEEQGGCGGNARHVRQFSTDSRFIWWWYWEEVRSNWFIAHITEIKIILLNILF